MTKIIAAGFALLLLTDTAWTASMPALARQNGCTACHDLNKMMVGPPWMDVSRKYRNVGKYVYKDHEYALEDGLVMKISGGGSGNWGAMPMPPNDPDRAKQKEIHELVRFILQLVK